MGEGRDGARAHGREGGAPRVPGRAIGVVHRPSRERRGNHVPARLGGRYDAFRPLGRTVALTPPHPEPPGAGEEETWPTGV
ncbi:hypothetical protein [Streptomyces sp. enrichment culture]|uniref:hypothetical protein n=1 Tax=Streptomyces sp. enrichment culture TaxID=1795815 RepID=UPI003F578FE6